MSDKQERYKSALAGKKIPVLTLDNKWHKLFTQAESTKEIANLTEQLNSLLKKQGKINNDIKDRRKLKKKLMDEIVALMEVQDSKAVTKKKEENRRLIEKCNDELEDLEEEEPEVSAKIGELNDKLMLATMDSCYDRMKDNTAEFEELKEWVNQMRVELKKKLLRMQELDQANQELYSYMHDIFGADVIEIFDMKYRPQGYKNDRNKSE